MNAKLFKLFILCAVSLLSSCDRSWYEVRDMEQLLGTRLRGSVSFLDRQEEWVNLNGDGVYQTAEDLEKYPKQTGSTVGSVRYRDVNGDGEKVVLFDVLDAKPFYQCQMLPYDSTWVEQSFRPSHHIYYSCLKGTAGYYVEQHDDDMWQYLFYDTVDNRLVYYLVIM